MSVRFGTRAEGDCGRQEVAAKNEATNRRVSRLSRLARSAEAFAPSPKTEGRRAWAARGTWAAAHRCQRLPGRRYRAKRWLYPLVPFNACDGDHRAGFRSHSGGLNRSSLRSSIEPKDQEERSI